MWISQLNGAEVQTQGSLVGLATFPIEYIISWHIAYSVKLILSIP